MRKEELHVSSLIVHINIKKSDSITEKINTQPGTEVISVSPEGKVIVVLEASNQGEIMKVIDAINTFDGVINTGLVYHEFETLEETA